MAKGRPANPTVLQPDMSRCFIREGMGRRRSQYFNGYVFQKERTIHRGKRTFRQKALQAFIVKKLKVFEVDDGGTRTQKTVKEGLPIMDG